jgi:ParB family chromosome partitioning protein
VAERQRGMGRGLAAILSPTIPAEGSEATPELRRLPIELIAPNPRQPRQTIDEESLLALSESVKERGILQPVLVRPCPGGSYELIAGERRWRAAQLAGLDVLPAVVAPHEDRESLELALIENMAREDLNPIEEARACSLLVDELGLTREEVGRRVGRSRVAVSNLLRLLDLPDEILELLVAGRLSEGHGRALLMAPDHADRRRLGRAAADEGWTVRETEARAREAAHPPEVAPKPRRQVHPDQEEAATRLGDAFGRALGTEVKVTPRGTGYRVALTFESLDEALELASRLDVPEAP